MNITTPATTPAGNEEPKNQSEEKKIPDLKPTRPGHFRGPVYVTPSYRAKQMAAHIQLANEAQGPLSLSLSRERWSMIMIARVIDMLGVLTPCARSGDLHADEWWTAAEHARTTREKDPASTCSCVRASRIDPAISFNSRAAVSGCACNVRGRRGHGLSVGSLWLRWEREKGFYGVAVLCLVLEQKSCRCI